VKTLFYIRVSSATGKDVEYCNEYKERVNFSSLCFFPGDTTDRQRNLSSVQYTAFFASQIVEILIREYQKSDFPDNFDALIVRFEPTEITAVIVQIHPAMK